MRRPQKASAFSLVEVVIAVGVFAIAITGILAVLPAITRNAADSAESFTAQGLTDAVESELTRLSAKAFDSLANAVPVMSTPLDHGLELVAAHDGEHVQSLSLFAPTTVRLGPDDQFFLIESWRFNESPLAYAPTGTVLPLFVRVSWPYRLPGVARPVPLSDRSQFTFTLAISR
jgi:type II secretory pathway pseudopilin PulG